ncbi:mitochondrial splicing system protein [Serendipita sp. 397]|nr:mitochondrial splicing system protein [Serendipita sp. 397]
MHMENAVEYLEQFIRSVDGKDGHLNVVLGAEELRYAAREIGQISRAVTVDDVLDAVFRDFCIGK